MNRNESYIADPLTSTLASRNTTRAPTRLVASAIPPLLLSIHPALSLLASNLREAEPADAIRPALVAGAIGLFAFAVLLALYRQAWKASLVASVAILAFFTYGPIYASLKEARVFGVLLGRHRILLPVLAVALALVVWRVARSRASGRLMLPLLCAMALAALLPPVVQICVYILRTDLAPHQVETRASPLPALHAPSAGAAARPDIYFIILDAHAREDVLREDYGYTEYDFPERLRALGFVVANEARSNYLRTILSVPATLNMEYLDELSIALDTDYRIALADAISHSRIRGLLEGAGYTTYAVTSSYAATEIVDADHYLTPNMRGLDQLQATWAFTDFEQLLLRQSALGAILDLQYQLHSSAASFLVHGVNNARAIRRDVILSALEHLEEAAKIPGPKFFFVHIVAPHSPYLFGASGQATDFPVVDRKVDELVLPGGLTWIRYRDQMDFIDDQIVRVTQHLLSVSATTPVILIQSDHGPETGFDLAHPEAISMHQRTAILSAAHLPEACRPTFYPTVTSVNTFRIVLNCLFDAGLPLKPDRSFVDDETSDGLLFHLLDLTAYDSEAP